MPKSFKPVLPSAVSFSDPKFVVRLCLGVLLAANLVAAAFAFHLFDPSPEALERDLAAALSQRAAAQARLLRSRNLTANIDRGKTEGERFVGAYMTPRQFTYSTIINELISTSKTAGMDKPQAQIALNAIPGSDDLDMMSVTMSLEGKYAQLVKFVNLLDRSPRFLIIESLTVTPRAKSDVLTVNVKLDTFVKDDKEGTS
jgi:type IV pilus assembly protein PilO